MFFPLMKTEGLEGFLELLYIAPNSWENRIRRSVFLYLIWSSGENWETELVGTLNHGQNFRITTNEVEPDKMTSELAFIYPSLIPMPNILKTLPTKNTWSTHIPEWRNTTGFSNEWAQTSYQSEVIPFPPKANLLTFHPFIQYGSVTNKLLVLNLSNNPESEALYFDNRRRLGLLALRSIDSN